VISELLMGVMAAFMLVWGIKLALATWGNSVDEFPWLSVGVTYLPIAISGAMMLLFVIERLTIGPPPSSGVDPHLPLE
jgi:TRAP-type C4-dicarboxylate transport system permease small subunit